MVKLFAKRKKKVAGGDAAGAAAAADQSSSDPPKKEEVETRQLSYFDKNFRPGSSFADKDSSKGSGKDADEEVQRLLAMEPSELNSKQRRILKRYRARSNISDEVFAEEADNNRDVETKAAKDTAKPDEEKEPEVKPEQNSGEQSSEKEGGTEPPKDNDDETNEDEGAADDGKSLAEQLKGLNSKERRKLLRKLRRDDPEKIAESGALAEAEDEAKKIAEQNRKEQEEQSKKRKREVDEEKNATNGNGDQQAGTEKKKGKKSKVDWSTLTPEERARREKQREMQQEAKRRREAGEVDETRHPLNSERRRANRRKPGRAGKIAALVRGERAKKKEGVLAAYNASGYTMRRNKKDGGA